MKSLFYISKSKLPSTAANSVHVMKMCQAFSRQGITVELSAIRPRKHDLVDFGVIFSEYAVEPKFDLHLFGFPNLPARTEFHILSSLKKARNIGSDVIYTRIPRAAVLGELLGWPSVIELHHPGSYATLKAYLRIARRPIIVVITDTLRKRIIADLNCDPNSIIVAPDGADPMPIGVQSLLPASPEGRLRVGYLGHLYKGKGMELISLIAPHCPWADFEIVGGTQDDIAMWKSYIGGLPNVRFHGHVPHSMTPGYLSGFDVALLPNQGFVGVSVGSNLNISRWTSPLKAFEYMSAGLPIIASDQPNLREVLSHNVNGLLCPASDAEAWCKALELLRASPELRSRLGQNALEIFTREYSWDARARKLVTAVELRLAAEK